MNSEYYDLQHLKAIPIADYLHTTCDIGPARRYNGYALYHTPHREDFNANMRIDFWGNLWYDYGTGQGESIIDLVMCIQGCSAYEATKHLVGKRETIIVPSSFHCENHIEHRRGGQRANNRRHILSISDKLPSCLQRYLRKVREINLVVASEYLRHIHYKVGGREYSAIKFPDRSGEYELRGNNAFKGTIAPEDISVVAGRGGNTPPYIFEGFMDFLPLLTISRREMAPCLMSNSVNSISRAIAYLQEQDVDSVRAFLDNNPVRRQALLTIQSSGVMVEDVSRYYARYKDLNESLVA